MTAFSMKLLAAELEALGVLIADPVLKYYGDQLIHYIGGTAVDYKSRMSITV